MSDRATDRVVHIALTRLLGGVEPPDLTDRVLARIRGGRIESRDVWSPRRRVLAAAACILALALPAWLILRDRGPSEVVGATEVAVSATPVTIVSANEVERVGDRIRDGETAVFTEAGTVVLVSGGQLAAEAGSRVRFRLLDGGPEARFLDGRVLVVNPDGATMTLATAGGSVEMSGNTEVAASTKPVLNFRILRGPVILGPGGLGLAAPSGSFVAMSPDAEPTIAPLPPDPDRRRADALIADATWPLDCPDLSNPAVQEMVKRSATAMTTLRETVDAGDDPGAYVVAVLAHMPPDAAPGGMSDNVQELLLRDHEGRATSVLARALAKTPGAFGPTQLIAAVEAGVPGAEERLVRRYEGAMGEAERRNIAALLALRGDARGRDVLREAMDRVNRGLREDRLLVAAALHRLAEPGFWTTEVAWQAAEARRALDAGILDYARGATIRIAYFHQGLDPDGDLRVAYFRDRIRSRQVLSERALPTAGDVRRLLDVLTE